MAAEFTKQTWLSTTATKKCSHDKVKGISFYGLCLKWITLSENTYQKYNESTDEPEMPEPVGKKPYNILLVSF